MYKGCRDKSKYDLNDIYIYMYIYIMLMSRQLYISLNNLIIYINIIQYNIDAYKIII